MDDTIGNQPQVTASPAQAEEVAALIAETDRLVVQGASIETLFGQVRKLVVAAPNSIGTIVSPGQILFRATKHHRAIPTRLDELWHPPPEKAPMNRASRKGCSMFYGSSDDNGVLREIGAAVGQMAVLATWATTETLMLHDLGYTDQVLKRSGARRQIPEKHRNFYANADDVSKTVRDYLALAFTEPGDSKYALTVAIAEFHLQGFDEAAGLMYPAVAKNGNVDNVALRPSMAERALKLKEAKIIHIDTVEGETIGGVILADLVEVGADRTLTWKFRSQNSTTIPSGVSYGAQPGERLRVQESGELTIGGKRYRLEPGFLLEVNDQAVIVRDLRGQIVEPTADEAYTWTFSLKQETAQS